MSSAGDKKLRKKQTWAHSAFHHKVLGSHVKIWPQLDEEAFPLEAQLTHFSPVEGVNLCVTLQ